MRDYARVSARFWTGDTGRMLRKHRDARDVALYLMTAPDSNMIGLYTLILPTAAHHLGLPMDLVEAALDVLASPEMNFAFYDEGSETVFVVNMAAEQVARELHPGEKRDDNRRVAVLRELEKYQRSPLASLWIDRYRIPFHLTDNEVSVAPSTRGTGNASEGAQQTLSKGSSTKDGTPSPSGAGASSGSGTGEGTGQGLRASSGAPGTCPSNSLPDSESEADKLEWLLHEVWEVIGKPETGQTIVEVTKLCRELGGHLTRRLLKQTQKVIDDGRIKETPTAYFRGACNAELKQKRASGSESTANGDATVEDQYASTEAHQPTRDAQRRGAPTAPTPSDTDTSRNPREAGA